MGTPPTPNLLIIQPTFATFKRAGIISENFVRRIGHFLAPLRIDKGFKFPLNDDSVVPVHMQMIWTRVIAQAMMSENTLRAYIPSMYCRRLNKRYKSSMGGKAIDDRINALRKYLSLDIQIGHLRFQIIHEHQNQIIANVRAALIDALQL